MTRTASGPAALVLRSFSSHRPASAEKPRFSALPFRKWKLCFEAFRVMRRAQHGKRGFHLFEKQVEDLFESVSPDLFTEFAHAIPVYHGTLIAFSATIRTTSSERVNMIADAENFRDSPDINSWCPSCHRNERQVMTVRAVETIDPSHDAAQDGLRRVLVVDDSRAQRRLVCTYLRQWGYSIEEAESGVAALEICRRTRPDLILSDWMMPGMSGPEFCRAIRGMTFDSYVYFILLTSKSGKEDIALGLDAGADDFLTKPVNAAELRARIGAGARILQMERELTAKNRLVRSTLDELQALYDSLDSDLLEAKKLQQSLLSERHRDFGLPMSRSRCDRRDMSAATLSACFRSATSVSVFTGST